MTTLEDPIEIGGLEISNRLYRAPLLECAGNGPDAVDTLIDELEPAAESGVGLVFQGASIVTPEGGCAAPNMTRFHDPEFVAECERLTDAIHDHGGQIFVQLGHGGLRSLELWHAEHRAANPNVRQATVSRPPWHLRLANRAGLIDLRPDVLSTDEVYEVAAAFGRAAGYAVDAGYDGIHLSGANMSLIQQFLSPYYNRREDEFGDGVRFLLAIRDAVRSHAGDVPLVTKVPVETGSPRFVRRKLNVDDGVQIAERLANVGFDALVPVSCSVYWDMSIVRGAFPERAWAASELQTDYAAAFGGPLRAKLVRGLNRLQARRHDHDPGWNEGLCRAVRERVDVPVLCEGGLRTREHCEGLLGTGECSPAADMVGMGRPFYAEPRLGARLLGNQDSPAGNRAVLCERCNNCTVPQVGGEPGRCRTPHVVRAQSKLAERGSYDRKNE